MASLRTLLVMLSAGVALSGLDAAPARKSLSSFVTTTDLGHIHPVTANKILNAFVARNPRLPDRLRVRVRPASGDSTQLRVFPIYPDGRALVHVPSTAGDYTGALEVYFNGGGPPSRSAVEDVISLDESPLSLQQLPRRASDAQILDAYVSQHAHLPRGLRAELRVRQQTPGRAVVYVDSPRSRYQGRAVVTW